MLFFLMGNTDSITKVQLDTFNFAGGQMWIELCIFKIPGFLYPQIYTSNATEYKVMHVDLYLVILN